MVLTIYCTVIFKKRAIAMAACLVFMSGCHLTAYIFPYLFPLIFIDQLSFGAAYVFLEVVSVSCTISWFPENQVEIALAIGGGIGNRVISLLEFIVPSNYFFPNSISKQFWRSHKFDFESKIC